MNALTVVLPPKTLTLWRIRVFVLTFTVSLAFALFLRPLAVAAFTVCALFYVAISLWYLPRLVDSFKLQKVSRGVIIRYGVFKEHKKLYLIRPKPPLFCFRTPVSALLGLEAAYIRTCSGFVLLPECERGKWCDYV